MTTNRAEPDSSAPSKPAGHRSLADFSLSDMAEMSGVPRRVLGRWFAEAGLEPVRTFANAKRFTMPQLIEILSIRGTANAQLADAKARKMAALAGIAEMRFARERECVVETALATEMVVAECDAVRARCIAWAEQIAPEVAATAGVSAKRDLLMAGVKELLRDLSSGVGIPEPDAMAR
jgi:hypothetical protein